METTRPQEYLDSAPEPGRPWLTHFWDFMAVRCPDLHPTMFRQVPMYKFGASYLDGYVMFTAAATHFSVHALEFDLVEQTRAAIPRAKGGKGSVAVKYADESARPALEDFVEQVLARNGL